MKGANKAFKQKRYNTLISILRNNMPFINIKLVPENGGPTNEQKQQLIEGVSDLMVKVLNKNKASVVVIIDEVDSNNYGLGGESVHHLRQKN